MNNIDILEEKEKRALENVKSLLLYSSEHEYFSPFKEEEIDDMNIVLNLVSILIAENKELKEKNNELEVINKMQEYRISVIDERELISKSKAEELLKQIENRNYNDYTGCQDGNEVKYNILLELQSLLGKE